MIEVGEYIRTKKGQIDRLHCEITDKWTSKNNYGETIARCENDTYLLKDIVKHSKNMIDLIEVGDYVNGKLVLDNNKTYLLVSTSDFSNSKIFNWAIKAIVTKEQFAQIEYKIEEDK